MSDLENIVLPEGCMLVTPLPEYYKPKSSALDLSSARDRRYVVGIIEKVSYDIEEESVGGEVFYYKTDNPMVIDLNGLGSFERIEKSSILLVDLTIILNKNNDDKETE